MTDVYSAGVASEALFLFFELVISEYEENMEYSYPGFGFPSPLEGEFQEGWLFFFFFYFYFYSFGHSPLEENVTHGKHPQNS